MKTKKWGIYAALAVVLLAAVALVVSCPALNPTTGNTHKYADGMGSVKLNFNNDISRAILPTGGTLADFTMFELQFVGITGSSDTYFLNNTIGVDANSRDVQLDLAPGTYDLDVVAYLDGVVVNNKNRPDGTGGSTTPGRPAAAASTQDTPATITSTPVPITVTGSANTAIAVNLHAFTDDPTGFTIGDQGRFEWDITNSFTTPADLDTATLTITPIASGTPQAPIDITANLISGTNLAGGYYYVDFHFKTVAEGTIDFRHVLHIYQNRTSSFAYAINDNLVLIILSGTVSATWSYTAPTVTAPTLTSTVAPLAPIEGNTINLTGGTTTVTLTISNVAGTFATYGWYSGSSGNSLSTTNTLIINTVPGAGATPPFTEAGLHQLTIVGITDAGVPSNTNIFINVGP